MSLLLQCIAVEFLTTVFKVSLDLNLTLEKLLRAAVRKITLSTEALLIRKLKGKEAAAVRFAVSGLQQDWPVLHNRISSVCAPALLLTIVVCEVTPFIQVAESSLVEVDKIQFDCCSFFLWKLLDGGTGLLPFAIVGALSWESIRSYICPILYPQQQHSMEDLQCVFEEGQVGVQLRLPRTTQILKCCHSAFGHKLNHPLGTCVCTTGYPFFTVLLVPRYTLAHPKMLLHWPALASSSSERVGTV